MKKTHIKNESLYVRDMLLIMWQTFNYIAVFQLIFSGNFSVSHEWCSPGRDGFHYFLFQCKSGIDWAMFALTGEHRASTMDLRWTLFFAVLFCFSQAGVILFELIMDIALPRPSLCYLKFFCFCITFYCNFRQFFSWLLSVTLLVTF